MKKTLIERIEVGSGGAATIVFTSIPQTYDGLYLVCSLRTDTDPETFLYPNGSTSNLSGQFVRGNGASADATSLIRWYSNLSSATANTFSNMTAHFPNYAGSTYKSFSADGVTENNATTAYASINAGLWSDTTAISSLTIDLSNGNFVQYSSATLYGITAGSDGTTTVS